MTTAQLMERLGPDVFGLGGAQCAGCGSNLASNLMYRFLSNRDDVIVRGGSCGAGRIYGAGEGMGTEAAGVSGWDEALQVQGITDKKIVYHTGEGRLQDMGLGTTLSAIMRQQQVLLICWNNETFAMSGYHATNRTPLGANTKVLLRGKSFGAAQVPLLAAFSGAKYVATASLAYPEDYEAKVLRGLEDLPSLIDVLCPCESGWRYPVEQTVALARLAVRCGLYPLWEYRNRDGKVTFRRTVRVFNQVPVRQYTQNQRRFRHLKESDFPNIEKWVEETNNLLDRLEVAFPV